MTVPLCAQMVGGPFDGKEHYFNPNDWEEDERRYHLWHESGIIEDLTVFSTKFSEGGLYRWNEKEGVWKYVGRPSAESRKNFSRLVKAVRERTGENS